MSKVVVIDPGHGGRDSGAVGSGLYEKNITLEMSRLIRDELVGLDVYMTRDKDIFVSLSGRAKISNSKKTDVFVSIHVNSAANPTATGYETYHYPGSVRGADLARAVHPRVAKYWTADRGIKTANFAVLRETLAPAILLELGFIKNQQDMDILRREMRNIAKDIAEGIREFLGVEKMNKSKNTVDINQVSSWAEKEWKEAQKLGITDGSRPKANATREEVASMILRAIQINK